MTKFCPVALRAYSGTRLLALAVFQKTSQPVVPISLYLRITKNGKRRYVLADRKQGGS
jgi:hypothetical protein